MEEFQSEEEKYFINLVSCLSSASYKLTSTKISYKMKREGEEEELINL